MFHECKPIGFLLSCRLSKLFSGKFFWPVQKFQPFLRAMVSFSLRQRVLQIIASNSCHVSSSDTRSSLFQLHHILHFSSHVPQPTWHFMTLSVYVSAQLHQLINLCALHQWKLVVILKKDRKTYKQKMLGKETEQKFCQTCRRQNYQYLLCLK